MISNFSTIKYAHHFAPPTLELLSWKLVTLALRLPHSESKGWNIIKAPFAKTHYFQSKLHSYVFYFAISKGDSVSVAVILCFVSSSMNIAANLLCLSFA